MKIKELFENGDIQVSKRKVSASKLLSTKGWTRCDVQRHNHVSGSVYDSILDSMELANIMGAPASIFEVSYVTRDGKDFRLIDGATRMEALQRGFCQERSCNYMMNVVTYHVNSTAAEAALFEFLNSATPINAKDRRLVAHMGAGEDFFARFWRAHRSFSKNLGVACDKMAATAVIALADDAEISSMALAKEATWSYPESELSEVLKTSEYLYNKAPKWVVSNFPLACRTDIINGEKVHRPHERRQLAALVGALRRLGVDASTFMAKIAANEETYAQILERVGYEDLCTAAAVNNHRLENILTLRTAAEKAVRMLMEVE